jgi:hypothetical protein
VATWPTHPRAALPARRGIHRAAGNAPAVDITRGTPRTRHELDERRERERDERREGAHSHVALGPVVDRRRELVPQQRVVAHEPAGEEDPSDVVVLGVEIGQLRDVAAHHVHQRLHDVRAPAFTTMMMTKTTTRMHARWSEHQSESERACAHTSKTV